MKQLQGTAAGCYLDGNHVSIWGWTEMSYTGSTDSVTNQPVVWNDRANKFLLQQAWTRIEKQVQTTGTTEPTWGFRADILYGSDYRFTLQRGFLNSQLLSADGVTQNLYGVDLISAYAELYIPTLFMGTDIQAGHIWTPWGMESLSGLATPFVTRSYAFNWSPPFTHMGVYATSILTNEWKVGYGLINGNDVYIDPSQEARFLGTLQWTKPGGQDVVVLATSVGRGKFNAGDPFNPATIGLQTEAAGRNNFNAFDVVWTHTINSKISIANETIYAYQTGVPANVLGGIINGDKTVGNAQWFSTVGYVFYNFTPRVQLAYRAEFFDDTTGQRTGFKSNYTSTSIQAMLRPTKWFQFRQEFRYDYAGTDQRPFGQANGNFAHDIFVASSDVIIRW